MDGSSKFVKGDAIAGLIITAINIVGGIFIGAFQRGLADRPGALAVHDAHRRRRPRHADPGADHQHRRRHHGDARGGRHADGRDARDAAQRAPARDAHRRRACSAPSASCPAFRRFRSSCSAAASPRSAASPATRREEAHRSGRRRRVRRDAPAGTDGRSDERSASRSIRSSSKSATRSSRSSTKSRAAICSSASRCFASSRRRSSAFSSRPFAFATTFVCRPTSTSSSSAAPRSRAARSCRASCSRSTPAASSAASKASTRSTRASACRRVGSRPRKRVEAESLGYVVVEPATVVATHLMEKLKSSAADLLGRQDVQEMVDTLKKTHPALVDDVIPDKLTLGVLHRVLQRLLRERVPIRDLVTILEAVADAADQTKDPEAAHRTRAPRAHEHHRAAAHGRDRHRARHHVGPKLEMALLGLFSPRAESSRRRRCSRPTASARCSASSITCRAQRSSKDVRCRCSRRRRCASACAVSSSRCCRTCRSSRSPSCRRT